MTPFVLALHPLRRPSPLVPRAYDPDVEDVRSILTDLCAHLEAEHAALLELRTRDQRIVLGGLAELVAQIPAALAAYHRHDRFAIAFDRTRFAFSHVDEDEFTLEQSIVDGERSDFFANAFAVMIMLSGIHGTFLALAEAACPKLAWHPWILEWDPDQRVHVVDGPTTSLELSQLEMKLLSGAAMYAGSVPFRNTRLELPDDEYDAAYDCLVRPWLLARKIDPPGPYTASLTAETWTVLRSAVSMVLGECVSPVGWTDFRIAGSRTDEHEASFDDLVALATKLT